MKRLTMDTIDLREKNVFSTLKYIALLVIIVVITCLLPRPPIYMKIIISIMTLFCVGVLLWAAFFIKNELVFYKDKLVYTRYKGKFEFNYDEIASIKYSHILSAETNVVVPVHVQRHYLLITYKNSEEVTIQLYGRIFLEEEINTLLKKYNLV